MHWVPCVRHCAKCFILGFSADGETKATQLSKWQSSYLNSHPIGFEDRLSIVPYCFFVHPVPSQGQEHTDSQQRLVKWLREFPTVLGSCVFSTQCWRPEESKQNIDDSEEESGEKKNWKTKENEWKVEKVKRKKDLEEE